MTESQRPKHNLGAICLWVSALSLVSISLLALPWAQGQQPESLRTLLEPFAVRNIGPANMGGRITALAVVPTKPSTMYVAAASGGLWKTINQGNTWTPVFDNQSTASLGDVVVSASNPEIIWVGTGEANARNSVSWGDGVYKSTDGGKSWKNMGLKDSEHIGKIVIHPTNPDIVYVAALGRLWGPNKERGVYVTRDGGKTWEQSKFLNEDTGFIDLAMDPSEPDVVYAAAYRVRRDAFSGGNPAVQTGPEAGLYKTTDAGKTWKRLTKGLPERPLGRCGLAVSRKDPRIIYAVVQTDKTILVRETELGQGARANDQPETGGVFRSADRGETWVKLNDLCPRPFYFSKISIDPGDDQRIYVLGVTLHLSVDGGRTFRRNQAPAVHADHHALWINSANTDQLLLAGDGGLYFSFDRGVSWEHIHNLPIAQFYGIGVDMRKPYRVYGGLQDNGCWGGPSQTRSREGITSADWTRILGGDGFYCQVDPFDMDTVYAEGQYGFLNRVNVRTGEVVEIRPRPPQGSVAYRFNWASPLLVSPHDPRTIYFGGNYLFRSRPIVRGAGLGDVWNIISPDLTAGPPGPSPNFGHTLTTIAESPLKKGLLYTGSDDGQVHVSLDGGQNWSNVSARIPNVPFDAPDIPIAPNASKGWITRVECSAFAEGTAYLTLDRHRNDDRAPYVFKTEDHGQTWKSITGNLPAGSVHVIRADPRNRELLFVGTEFGLFVSLDGGGSWQPFGKGLPPVAVHDLVIHPRDRELVVATHGRGIYIADIAPLQELTPTVRESMVHLFEVKPATLFTYRAPRGLGPGKNYLAPNPEFGATLWYWLKAKSEQDVTVSVLDADGKSIFTVPGSKEPGLHQVHWPLRRGVKREDPLVLPGEYQAQITIGGLTQVRKIKVEAE
jgi:photosystem II stability/assembly factor-like uncharacterized protein